MGFFTKDYKIYLGEMKEDVFIETGTLRGESTKLALEYGFKEVHTIESSKRWFDWVSVNEAQLCNDSRIFRYWGPSEKVLPSVLYRYGMEERNLLFWLDAHYTGYEEERTVLDECPLLSELSYIVRCPSPNMLVVIDDARMFLPEFWEGDSAKFFRRSDWPTLHTINNMLQGWTAYAAGECFYYRKSQQVVG